MERRTKDRRRRRTSLGLLRKRHRMAAGIHDEGRPARTGGDRSAEAGVGIASRYGESPSVHAAMAGIDDEQRRMARGGDRAFDRAGEGALLPVRGMDARHSRAFWSKKIREFLDVFDKAAFVASDEKYVAGGHGDLGWKGGAGMLSGEKGRALESRRKGQPFRGYFPRTSRGFAPSPGPMKPSSSKRSIIRAARTYPTFKRR